MWSRGEQKKVVAQGGTPKLGYRMPDDMLKNLVSGDK